MRWRTANRRRSWPERRRRKLKPFIIHYDLSKPAKYLIPICSPLPLKSEWQEAADRVAGRRLSKQLRSVFRLGIFPKRKDF